MPYNLLQEGELEKIKKIQNENAEFKIFTKGVGPISETDIKGIKESEGDWHNAWETVMRGHAIANSLYVAAVNRVGTEDKLTFWGQSFVADSFGKVIKRASKSKEEILIAEVNLKDNQKISNEWGFMRNRRTDTYNTLAKNKTK